ncbi:hypothetical protein COX64_02480 [Candidatus Dojkabacteria bacterium CG_4_10_14_0_2_um_filter_Dojkabacteria_WS6_41_15]|uniref:Uncharacterized protein n=1 Tax=Candidatus Dojkabacteria bacterium CG_4_10_14_0_2_um_filter_Dojkabacteria_WS6_41_15 TaxID=2014249 RepID=A0A2M7W1Z8_9BACT|nr:MAG: hypothetical protein COX64_02480 [Candidatus Dojkabacteria bacterium CG_4_10_14_0_2_um_filter_Dojkabacteria_WS6_41_15]
MPLFVLHQDFEHIIRKIFQLHQQETLNAGFVVVLNEKYLRHLLQKKENELARFPFLITFSVE